MSIGPAGEKIVPIACAMVDRDHAAGRTGIGAVMGPKNFKAIAVRAGRSEEQEVSEEALRLVRGYIRRIRRSDQYETTRRHGGSGYVKWANDMGILATRNYRENRFEAAGELDGVNLAKHITRFRGCHRCPVRCKAELAMDSGAHSDEDSAKPAVRPEFEPMVSLGSKCGLSDLGTLVHLDNLCSQLGQDSASTGSAIAFAMTSTIGAFLAERIRAGSV
jgi:aldehyde:ferredoxin oxidoreductase